MGLPHALLQFVGGEGVFGQLAHVGEIHRLGVALAVGARRVNGLEAHPLLAPRAVAAQVQRDAVEIGGKRFVGAQRGQRVVQAHEHVLRHVLRVVRVAQHSIDRVVDAAMVELEDFLEGLAVAFLGALESLQKSHARRVGSRRVGRRVVRRIVFSRRFSRRVSSDDVAGSGQAV